MNINKQIEELEKGCGKNSYLGVIDKSTITYDCGTIRLCGICDLKLKLLKELKQQIKEEIDNINPVYHGDEGTSGFKDWDMIARELKQKLGVEE